MSARDAIPLPTIDAATAERIRAYVAELEERHGMSAGQFVATLEHFAHTSDPIAIEPYEIRFLLDLMVGVGVR